MKVIVIDTETNGLPLYHEPSEGENQPHIVELAALLFDGTDQIERLHYIVRPDGWMIPDDVAAIHGITTERAMDEGIPEHQVLEAYLALHARADLRVAHNEPFDARIIRIGIKRFGDGRPAWLLAPEEDRDAVADAYKNAPRYCTMRSSTKACNLPPTEAMVAKGMKFNKNPSLAEAYKHYTGEELVGAHSALIDAQACARVYFCLQGEGA
jgi:DNA polymerase-3 subunit epsilon